MFQTPGQAPLRGASTPDKPSASTTPPSTAAGRCRASPTSIRPRTTRDDSTGGARACSAGAPTTGAAFASQRSLRLQAAAAATGSDSTGRSTTRTLAPYYDKVEMLIGVYGANDGLENTPNSPPGCLLPPPKPRVSDLLVAAAGEAARHPGGRRAPRGAHAGARPSRTCRRSCIPATRTRRRSSPSTCSSRAACFWATPCGRGCSIRANYQSTTVHLPPALATGNLDILINAMVREVTLDKDGRASGVALHRQARPASRAHVKARVVVPRRERLRDGAHPAQLEVGAIPARPRQLQRQGRPLPHGHGRQHASTARFRCSRTCRRTTRTARAAATCTRRGGSTRSSSPASSASPAAITSSSAAAAACPSLGTVAGIEWLTGGSYGRKFKEDARRYYGSFVYFDGRGEMIPNEDCYCEIDPGRQGPVGHPGAALPLEMVRARDAPGRAHAERRSAQIIEAMGGRVKGAILTDGAKAIAPGGSIIHEVGGAIMGADPGEFGHQPLGPDLGREEPVRHRRRRFRLERRQESDADDHGAGLALRRSHARPDAAEGALNERAVTHRPPHHDQVGDRRRGLAACHPARMRSRAASHPPR